MPPALHSADRNGGYQGKADKQRCSRPHTISSPQFSLPTAQVCVHMANIPADRKPELAILHIFMSLRGTGIYLICNSGGHLVRGGLWWEGAVSGPQQLFFSSTLTQTCWASNPGSNWTRKRLAIRATGFVSPQPKSNGWLFLYLNFYPGILWQKAKSDDIWSPYQIFLGVVLLIFHWVLPNFGRNDINVHYWHFGFFLSMFIYFYVFCHVAS